jgi:two-component system, OmpR family, response regulator
MMADQFDYVPRILVVDDNQDAADSLAALLRAAGFEVEVSFDGNAALATAERFGPTACVLDIRMPGMDGYELARRLRERMPELPPMLATLTAFGGGDHPDRAVDAGFDLNFTKPANPRELIDILGECLRRDPRFVLDASVSVG